MKRQYLAFIMLIAFSIISSGCSNSNSQENLYTGTIEAETLYVQSEISGRITNLYVKEGDEIRKGDKIALLEVSQYEEQAKVAKANLEIAKLKYDQIKNGPKNQADIARLNIDQAQANYDLTNLMIKKGTITSPIDGTITNIYINAGEIAMAGGNIAQISDLKNLFIKIYIPEKNLNKVSLNQEVSIKVDSIKDSIKGKITYISPNGEFTPKNTVTKSSKEDVVYQVKVQILDHIKNLKPGMLADVIINE
ncbi:efflux RND transporter periplasmic adaptor subunit [Thermoanaerobacter uzonensis]|uniref:efflux RND transporter periplasmic adaptor subunit n=1 Tax=Thermoanaerobacter uzonensis TaxID=447593 RepID=UPI003D7696EC